MGENLIKIIDLRLLDTTHTHTHTCSEREPHTWKTHKYISYSKRVIHTHTHTLGTNQKHMLRKSRQCCNMCPLSDDEQYFWHLTFLMYLNVYAVCLSNQRCVQYVCLSMSECVFRFHAMPHVLWCSMLLMMLQTQLLFCEILFSDDYKVIVNTRQTLINRCR